jgi:hypothetical protein
MIGGGYFGSIYFASLGQQAAEGLDLCTPTGADTASGRYGSAGVPDEILVGVGSGRRASVTGSGSRNVTVGSGRRKATNPC